MRKCVCSKCGKKFYENDLNPAVHYSMPATVCSQCDIWDKTPSGGYVQMLNGEYKRKP
jgi:NAD-dependent SIR2 family protein deacetylase